MKYDTLTNSDEKAQLAEAATSADRAAAETVVQIEREHYQLTQQTQTEQVKNRIAEIERLLPGLKKDLPAALLKEAGAAEAERVLAQPADEPTPEPAGDQG